MQIDKVGSVYGPLWRRKMVEGQTLKLRWHRWCLTAFKFEIQGQVRAVLRSEEVTKEMLRKKGNVS